MKRLTIIMFVVLSLSVNSAWSSPEWVLLDGELNIPRHGLTGEALDGYIYAIGGVVLPGSPSDAQNAVSKYDPATDSWTLVASIPTPRHSLSSAVIDGWIYAVCGHVANSRSENQRYNGTSWESKASVYARSGPGVVAECDGKLYVFGGNHYATILSRFDIYNPTTNSWSYGGEMPAAAEPWRAVTLNCKIYLTASHHVDRKRVWCYDPVANTWDTSIPLMNVARSCCELQTVCGRIYAIGGHDGSGFVSSVESWAPGEASWRMEPSLNVARYQFASAVIGSNIYVFGGYDGSDIGSTEVLTVQEPVCGLTDLLVSSEGSSITRYDTETGSFKGAFIAAMPSYSHGITFGPDSNLYVTIHSSDEVLRFDGTTGVFIDTFVNSGEGGLDGPRGLVFGPDANLYVVSAHDRRVLRYNGTTGEFVDEFVPAYSGGLTCPTGLTFGPDNDSNLYVCSACTNEVLRYNGSTGAFIDVFVQADTNGPDHPDDLVFGSDSNLYVCSAHTDEVLRYNGNSGEFIDAFVPSGSAGLDYPIALRFGPDGNLYIAGYLSNNVVRSDGTTHEVFAEVSQPMALVFICEPAGPVELLLDLVQDVIDLNLQEGISNSLDAKLDASMQALDDINENNDVAAINTLEAFINAVKAQSGNKISADDANALIACAQEIIGLLTTE